MPWKPTAASDDRPGLPLPIIAVSEHVNCDAQSFSELPDEEGITRGGDHGMH
jgi:hypothetical protein